MSWHRTIAASAAVALVLGAGAGARAGGSKPDLVPWAMGGVTSSCYASGGTTYKKLVLNPSLKNQGKGDAVMPSGWQPWVSVGAAGAVTSVQGGPPSVIKPNQTVYFQVSLVVPVAQAGPSRRLASLSLPITVKADPNNFIGETDEQNNTWVYTGQSRLCPGT